MLRKSAEIDNSIHPIFITLTLPDEYYGHNLDIGHTKKIFKRFYTRLIREFDKAGILYRLEGENRKSGLHIGEWFPHYHLLVWGVEFFDLLPWVSMNWYECCGKLSDKHLQAGTRVENIRSYRGIKSYISKYLAKQNDYPVSPGRIWGFLNVHNIPFVKGILCLLDEKQAVQLMRLMRRFARLRGHDYKSLTIFCDAAFWWLNLDRMLC